VLASFLASTVEFVEALTIVLAVGMIRGWRSALLGTGAALLVLVLLVALFGSSLEHIPLPTVQLVVGTLLLMFGLRWLRKAVLRAAGLIALHDEEKAFAKQTAELKALGTARAASFDSIAFLTAFKIVMLEGIEVVFIVIAIGAGGPLILQASTGAVLALVMVMVLGLCLNRPLASIPENQLKFCVGVLLCGFGSFWVGEGSSLVWAGHDWVILGLIALFLALALVLVPVARYVSCRRPQRQPGVAARALEPPGAFRRFLAEIWGLFIDDGWMAAGVVLLSIAADLHTRWFSVSAHAVSAVFITGLASLLVWSTLRFSRAR
jgi:uncharacterized membrane protein